MNVTIMGIVNLTPDSFSDGGDCFDPQVAVKRVWEILEEGADVVDIGAESTRPGAESLEPEKEWARLKPVLSRLEKARKRISIDTRHPSTALKVCQEFGVGWINNVSGVFTEDIMMGLSSFKDLNYIAMHMHGVPQSMQQHPLSGSTAVQDVRRSFERFEEVRSQLDWSPQHFYFDPGIGFGKDDPGNWSLIAATSKLAELYPLCVGVSRKSLIGRFLKIEEPKQRDDASKILEVMSMLAGVRVVRTHQVEPLVRFRKMMNEVNHV